MTASATRLSPETSARLMRRAAIASVCVSSLLVALKLVAYFASHSVAMLSSLADSALDLFTSTLNLIAIRSALTPADAEHRFGHGKAEPLAGLAQGAFIAASALFLVVQSVQRLFAPEPVTHEGIALGVMLVSIAATVFLVRFQARVVRDTGSIAVGADRMHYVSDLVTNVAVLAAVLLAGLFGLPMFDPLFALFVAGVLVWSAWSVFRQSYDQLMDRELPDDEREAIKALVRAHPEVRNMHDLRTRGSGINRFIQFHIELDPSLGIEAAHRISDQVERTVCASFPGAEVIIHQDPAGAEKITPLMRS